MFYDYNKRNYLLPPGCKDLIDLLKLEQQKPSIPPELGEELSPEMAEFFTPWKLPSKHKKAKPAAAETGTPAAGSFREVELQEPIAVSSLAELVGQKPYHIIADFMALGIFTTVHSIVQFEAAATVLKKYGLIAKKAKA